MPPLPLAFEEIFATSLESNIGGSHEPHKWKPCKTIIKQEKAPIIDMSSKALALIDPFSISGSKNPQTNKDRNPIRANHAAVDPFMNSEIVI